MDEKEIVEYLKDTLRHDELNNIGLVITCPNCKSRGCKICKNGYIQPKKFIKEVMKNDKENNNNN